MTGGAPFVVVIAATAAAVGKSTLCENLAVYLKGLIEDLPVALICFDPLRNLAQTFELPGHPATLGAPLNRGAGLESRFTLGQFGVEYLAGNPGADLSPSVLRNLLRETRFPGILIIDAGPPNSKGASAALQAADLVLAPVRDAAGLAPLAEIRRELRKGGGSDQMLCLIPALIEHRQVPRGQLELLRFAAAERGCQVLDEDPWQWWFGINPSAPEQDP
jgi:cellulose biosynthesis protein BcsQ